MNIGTKIGHVTLHDNLRGVDDRYGHNYPLRHDQLYAFLGLDPKAHLPADGLPTRMIGNVPVWVVPKTDKHQGSARVWCRCPKCDRSVTFGKLNQHMKVHK